MCLMKLQYFNLYVGLTVCCHQMSTGINMFTNKMVNQFNMLTDNVLNEKKYVLVCMLVSVCCQYMSIFPAYIRSTGIKWWVKSK